MPNHTRRTSPLNIFHFIPVPIGIILTIYWAWKYLGLYRFLAELQLRWWHKYDPEITFFITLLAVIIPIAAAQLLIVKLMSLAGPRRAHPTHADDQRGSPVVALHGPRSTSPRAIFLTCVTIVGLCGLALSAYGAYEVHRARSAGPKTDADVADYEAGRAPAGTWLSVRGRALKDSSIGMKAGSESPKFFIPVVSPTWKPGAGVAMYLESGHSNIMPANFSPRFGPHPQDVPETWEGMITGEELPGLVRTRFENTPLAPAPKYVILAWGATPQKVADDGRMMIYAGIAVIVLGVLFGAFAAFLVHRRNRRTLAPGAPAVIVPAISSGPIRSL